MQRTWLAFTIGLGGLLVLMFTYGIAMMQRSEQIFREVRQLEARQEQSQRTLAEISEQIYQISLTVRDHLLDLNDSRDYLNQAEASHRKLEARLSDLAYLFPGSSETPVKRLRSEFEAYWAALQPVFDWTAEQRAMKGKHFLWQQQRPRRENLLAIADELQLLNEQSAQRQTADLRRGQEEFRRQSQAMLGACLLVGLLVAGASVVRISSLEQRARKHQESTEAAEHELRVLSNRLMSAQEEERKLISRELHDEVGQLLTGLRIELGSIERTRQDARFFEHLVEAKELAERTMRTVRDLAVGLRPSVLDDLGLAPALHWQAREFTRRNGQSVQIDISGETEELNDSTRTCVYRVVQEALTNCAKHAGASEIQVKLRGDGQTLELSVKDNGKGMENEQRGLGLIGIEERVRELGGRVKVRSASGAGTELEVSLPV